MTERRGRDTTGEWPTITEKHWYVLSIVSAMFTAVAIVAAFLFIFGDGFDGEHDTRLAQALAPFGVALFALVTFCTVSWRGSISVRQANQAENEGRARLLQEGAKLLSEPSKPSHVSAGVATLSVLIHSGQGDYAWSAMNLLADFVEDHMRSYHGNRHREEISGVMRSGDEAGFNTGRSITFCVVEPEEDYHYDDDPVYWHYIPGFASVKYFGGEFPFDDEYEIDRLENASFNGVTIARWNRVTIDGRFDRSTFKNCAITRVDSVDSLNHHANYKYAFEKCDFSNCIFADERMLAVDFREGENYFRADAPPTLAGGTAAIDWAALLNRRE
ncbi:hypothetical protein [Mesorhizobium sp. M0227]|uniref:hypothetical protein n=1 Tax=Mesorhizobium sp. M0227 TaxID=2956922 RepID=UPI0033393226